MISERLRRLAACLPDGCRTVADIGTDHGFLPIYAVKNGLAQRAVAADVRPGPLSRAADHVAREGLEEKISLRLSDGFERIAPGEADCAVIAGMGGDTVCGILSAGRETARTMRRLVLSPQSHAARVREWLERNGFRLVREELLTEDGKWYPILCAEPGEETLTDVRRSFGPRLLEKADPLLGQQLIRELEKTAEHLAGIPEESDRRRPLLARERLLRQGLAEWQEAAARKENDHDI